MVGVPVYAERGREGGFHLVEGYFLPPVMFSRSEAISLLLAITMLRSLRSRPFAADLETAEEKLLASMPALLRSTLSEARKVVGVEAAPTDPFHPEPEAASASHDSAAEGDRVTAYLQALLDAKGLAMGYRTPYGGSTQSLRVEPLGAFWDRDRWYLVGRPEGAKEVRFWRADRVLEVRPLPGRIDGEESFDVREVLGRRWLRSAMDAWASEVPVRIRISALQRERLGNDWYYQHAGFEALSEDSFVITFGEDNRDVVFDLLRWLGPGAELLEPVEWRQAFRVELEEMASYYRPEGGESNEPVSAQD
jgi:predicted DNA-binding transcriptional regulator YafY